MNVQTELQCPPWSCDKSSNQPALRTASSTMSTTYPADLYGHRQLSSAGLTILTRLKEGCDSGISCWTEVLGLLPHQRNGAACTLRQPLPHPAAATLSPIVPYWPLVHPTYLFQILLYSCVILPDTQTGLWTFPLQTAAACQLACKPPETCNFLLFFPLALFIRCQLEVARWPRLMTHDLALNNGNGDCRVC